MTNKIYCKKYKNEIIIRVLMFATYYILDIFPAHHKYIHPHDYCYYTYPNVPSICPAKSFFPILMGTPLLVILFYYYLTGDKSDAGEALLAYSLGVTVTQFVTGLLKSTVGRPRPNYLTHCFPDGYYSDDLVCRTGGRYDVNGRKSFPSGHSSIAFATMSFISFYIAGKLRTFSVPTDQQGCKLFVFLIPFSFATLIGISRICDYHHHWQDVLVGATIGTLIMWTCYVQYFPSITSYYSDLPNSTWKELLETNRATQFEGPKHSGRLCSDLISGWK